MNFYLTALILSLGLTFMAWGIYISLKILSLPDITTDGSYTLGAAVSALLITQGYPWYTAMIVSLLAGGLAGFLTGVIHTRLNMQALLAGILVMTALYSVNLMIMGRSNIPLLENDMFFDRIALSNHEPLNQFFILGLFVSLGGLALKRFLVTDFGIALRASGNATPMARSMGVNTDRMKIIGLAVANALTALSGCFLAQLQRFSDINMGVGIVIFGLGSVILGETLTGFIGKKGIGWDIIGVAAGCILFRMAIAVSLQYGADPVLLRLITALIVVFIIGLPQLKKRRTG